MRNHGRRQIYEGLSVWERVLLVLSSWRERQPDDPAFRLGLRADDAERFNNYIDLLNRSHDLLGRFAVRLEGKLLNLVARDDALLDCNLWELERRRLAAEVEKTVKESGNADRALLPDLRRVFRGYNKSAGSRPTMKKPQVEERRQRAERNLAAIKNEFGDASSQLLAAEQVVAELREEFRGEDPLHPAIRCALDKAQERLDKLSKRLKRKRGKLSVPEPDQDLVEALRAGIWQNVDGEQVLLRARIPREQTNGRQEDEAVEFTLRIGDERSMRRLAQGAEASASPGEKEA